MEWRSLYSEAETGGIVMSIFECFPFEIFIFQNGNGDLITMKIDKTYERER